MIYPAQYENYSHDLFIPPLFADTLILLFAKEGINLSATIRNRKDMYPLRFYPVSFLKNSTEPSRLDSLMFLSFCCDVT